MYLSVISTRTVLPVEPPACTVMKHDVLFRELLHLNDDKWVRGFDCFAGLGQVPSMYVPDLFDNAAFSSDLDFL